jgi:hypothetical protein
MQRAPAKGLVSAAADIVLLDRKAVAAAQLPHSATVVGLEASQNSMVCMSENV